MISGKRCEVEWRKRLVLQINSKFVEILSSENRSINMIDDIYHISV